MSLDESALAKQIFNEQQKFNFPDLFIEIEKLISQLDLPNITNKDINNDIYKIEWKKQVKSGVSKICEIYLKNEISKLDKLAKSEMVKEEFKTKKIHKRNEYE